MDVVEETLRGVFLSWKGTGRSQPQISACKWSLPSSPELMGHYFQGPLVYPSNLYSLLLILFLNEALISMCKN